MDYQEKIKEREEQLKKFQEYYANLNPEQREAVDNIEGPVMAIAGAGTGKTQMLSVRIAKILLETQVSPWNILCLTFTEAGVSAMRKRLIEIIGTAAYYIKITTFHSFCNEIIQDRPEKFIFIKNFQQVDDFEKIEIFLEAIDEGGSKNLLRPLNDPHFYLRDIESAIKNLKQENYNPEKFSQIMKQLENFFEIYYPTIENLLSIKGSPPEEALHLFLAEINRLRETSSLTPIAKIYVNFIDQAYESYKKALPTVKK